MSARGGQRMSHPKTRTGCKVCKRRKIKCDEQRPSCHNCIKHSVECGYLLAQLPATPTSTQGQREHSSPAANGVLLAPESHPSNHYNAAPPALQMLQLQLLHHYTASTCFTIPGNPMMKTLMKVTLPQVAFSHEFVMRGILAFSAQHLAYCQPERRDFWTAHAMIEHRAASAVAMSVLSNVTVENCPALYVFAMLTTLFALASPRKPGDFFLIGENAEWLFLLRGVRSIMDMSAGSLAKTPLGPLFIAGARRHRLREEHTDKNYLEELEMYISTTADPQTHHIYRHAVEELKQSYNVIYANASANIDMTDIFIWPYCVKDEYLILLRQHTQESLVIFAYFCVLLKRLEGHWWMRDRSTQLVAQIYDVLNEECRLWIRWPMEEIGWAPGTPQQR